MKKQNMEKRNNWIKAIVMILVGAFCLYLTAPVIIASLQFLGINQEIEEVRKSNNPTVTVVAREAEVERLKQEREEMARENSVIAILLASHEDKLANAGRNMFILITVLLFTLGAVINGVAIGKISCEIAEKFNKKEQNQKEKENVDTSKKVNPFDGFAEATAERLNRLEQLQAEGEKILNDYENEMEELLT